MAEPFRKVKKEMLRVMIPANLDSALSIAAVKAGRTRSEFLTLTLCEKLRVDPSRFGLSSEEGQRRPKAVTPA